MKAALDRALETTRAGIPARSRSGRSCDLFQEAGYPTQLSKGPGEVLTSGFFHGLGHGVGLEVHEPPWLGRAPGDMVAGDVVTLEPGLYRQGFGGVRLEDLVLVTENGAENLTEYPYDLDNRERKHATIETLLAEERRFPPPPEFAAQANAQPDIYDLSFEELWEREGRERVTWFEPFTSLYEWELPYAKWYLGGKLNATYNCVDRHVEAGNGGKVAYYWEGEPGDERREITFADLQRETTKLANALKALGVKKGTPVGIYMGMVPETPVAMLACARIGAPHTVVFGGFSADSLRDRMQDMGCEVLITQDEAWRRGQTVPLKQTADEAMARVAVGALVRRVEADRRRRADDRGARRLVARRRDRRERVSVRADGLGGPALPPVHVGDDREAEGDHPHDRRVSRGARPPTTTSSTSSPTRSTGAPPTSAG